MLHIIRYTALALVLLGALNWGLVGIFNFDLVARIFGDMSVVTRSIYILIGVSAFFAGLGSYACYRDNITVEYE